MNGPRSVNEGLAKKKHEHYGVKNYPKLDALVCVNLRGRHLWPLEPTLNDEVAHDLRRPGWRSVSMLFVPYGAVLVAQPVAPDFLRDKVGLILNRSPHCDGLFDA